MDNKTIENLKVIEFPNTIPFADARDYSVRGGYSFKGIMKSGEMAGIQWIQVYKDGELVAEIKESICNLYYQ